MLIGDGASDRKAALLADVVFAKDSLAQFCLERGWPFEPWTTFAEIHRWLDVRTRSFAMDPSSLSGPVARRPFCGAEVWGPNRIDPPASDQVPPNEGRLPG